MADMTHQARVNATRQRIAETAGAMIRGELSFIEGSHLIRGLHNSAEMDAFDPDLIPFIVISSECEALPMGDVSQHWAPEALARLQPKIEHAEKWARESKWQRENKGPSEPTGFYCQNLIDRFGPAAIRRQIARAARAILDGDVTPFEGAQQIVFLRSYADLSEFDSDLLSFTEILSKHDFMPLSDGRENWPREALDQEYPEIRQAEEWANQLITSDCQKLIDRFSK